jgi:hypothetical protein
VNAFKSSGFSGVRLVPVEATAKRKDYDIALWELVVDGREVPQEEYEYRICEVCGRTAFREVSGFTLDRERSSRSDLFCLGTRSASPVRDNALHACVAT